MKDFLKPYSDMSAYYVTIDRTMITELLDAVREKMQYTVIETHEDYYLLASDKDERAFLLATKAIQPFYGIAIKCKTAEKLLFFDTIEPFLCRTEELWGMSHADVDDYPDCFHWNYKVKNPVEDDLQRCGLI